MANESKTQEELEQENIQLKSTVDQLKKEIQQLKWQLTQQD
jgi:hypothetical protein